MASKKNYFGLNAQFETIDYLSFFLPLALFAIGGLTLGTYMKAPWLFMSSFVFLWVGIFLKISLRVNAENDWVVVERLNQFHRVMHKGFYLVLFPGLIDRVKMRGTYKGTKPIPLFADVPDIELDFKDGSAPVSAYARYHVGNPADRQAERWDKLAEDVRKFAYIVGDPEGFVIEAFEASLRPLLQEDTLDEASVNGRKHALEARDEAALIIEKYGCYPTAEKAIYIDDIDVPLRIQELRELVLKGQKEAAATLSKHQEPAQAIIAIKSLLEQANGGEPIALERVIDLIQQQRVLDMLSTTGSNISFVSPDIGGVMKTVEIGRRD